MVPFQTASYLCNVSIVSRVSLHELLFFKVFAYYKNFDFLQFNSMPYLSYFTVNWCLQVVQLSDITAVSVCRNLLILSPLMFMPFLIPLVVYLNSISEYLLNNICDKMQPWRTPRFSINSCEVPLPIVARCFKYIGFQLLNPCHQYTRCLQYLKQFVMLQFVECSNWTLPISRNFKIFCSCWCSQVAFW